MESEARSYSASDVSVPISRMPWGIFVFLFIGGFLFLAIAAYLVHGAVSGWYLNYFGILFGSICFGAPGAFMILYSLSLKRVSIEEGLLRTWSLCGRPREAIELVKINSWSERHGTEYMTGWKELKIWHDRGRIALSNKVCDNYEEIKNIVTEGRPYAFEREKLASRRLARLGGAVLVILSLWPLGGALQNALEGPPVYHLDDYVPITGVVANVPEVERGARNHPFVNIILQEHPTLSFTLNLMPRQVFYEYERWARQGDRIELHIRRDDHEKYIAQTRPLTFFEDKFSGRGVVCVHGLRVPQALLIEPWGVVEHQRSDYPWALALGGGMGLVFLLFGLTIYKQGREDHTMPA